MKWTRMTSIALTVGVCLVLIAGAQTSSAPVLASKPIGEGTYRSYTWYRALKLGLAPYVDPALVHNAGKAYAYQLGRPDAVDSETRCRLLDALVKGEAAIAVRGSRGEWEISQAVQSAHTTDYAQFLQARIRAQRAASDDEHRRRTAAWTIRGLRDPPASPLIVATARHDWVAAESASSGSVVVISMMSDASSTGRSPELTSGSPAREGAECAAFTLWLSRLHGEGGELSFVGFSPRVGTLDGERVVAWDTRAFASAWGELP